MKPQPTLSVSVKLWLHSDMSMWVPFLGSRGHYEFKSGGHLKLQQKNRAFVTCYQIMEHKRERF